MISVPSGSFERISSPLALWRAYTQHTRGKLRRPAVARFSLDADSAVLALARSLDAGAYWPGPFYQLVVREPKTRLISIPALRDRVLHQAIVTELDPHYRRGYIDSTYACLPGRGPQRAVLRYLDLTRRFRFRLSLDIQRYFPSVNHDILLENVIFVKLRDVRTQALLRAQLAAGGAVYHTPLAIDVLGLRQHPVSAGTGLAIGSCLSQWAANLYLDGLDHYVKRVLKVPAYLRYMDDFTLFADDKGFLAFARATIAGWLMQQRRLSLNPKRQHIRPATEPSTFLGYRVTRAGLKPGEKMERRLVINVRRAASEGPAALARTVRSYRALVGFGSVGR